VNLFATLTLAFYARLVIGLCVLSALFLYVDVGQLIARLRAVSPTYAVAMCCVALGSRVLRGVKWNMLLRVQDVHLSWWQVTRISFISHFFAAWMPGSIGGDAYRLAALRRFNKTPAVLSSMFVERYIGLLVQTLFVVVALPWTIPYLMQLSPLVTAVIGGFVLLVAVFVPAILSPAFVRQLGNLSSKMAGGGWIGGKVRLFHHALAEYAQRPAILFIFGLLTILEVFSFFLVNLLSARAVGLEVGVAYWLFAMPVVHLILHIPISVQSLGVQEGVFATALVVLGFTAADGMSISLVQRAVEWLCSILPGAAFLLLTPGTWSQMDETRDRSADHRHVAGTASRG
jgi:uncharacterized protein (TIRG00374 family)